MNRGLDEMTSAGENYEAKNIEQNIEQSAPGYL